MTQKTTPTLPLPDKLKELNIVATTPITLRRGAPGRRLNLPDLRSPDELKGTWFDDPDELREARKEQERPSSDDNGQS